MENICIGSGATEWPLAPLTERYSVPFILGPSELC